MIHWVINVIVLTWIFVWFRSVLVSYWNMFSEGTVAVTTKFHHVLLQRSNILFFFGDDTGTLLMFLLNIWHQTVRASIDVNEKKYTRYPGEDWNYEQDRHQYLVQHDCTCTPWSVSLALLPCEHCLSEHWYHIQINWMGSNSHTLTISVLHNYASSLCPSGTATTSQLNSKLTLYLMQEPVFSDVDQQLHRMLLHAIQNNDASSGIQLQKNLHSSLFPLRCLHNLLSSSMHRPARPKAQARRLVKRNAAMLISFANQLIQKARFFPY